MRFLEQPLHTLSTYLLPSACIVCQQFQDQYICQKCMQLIYSDCLIHYECCYQCGIPLLAQELLGQQCQQCKETSPYFDQTVCLDRYEGHLKESLHQLKYQKRLSFCVGLASAWNQAFSTSLECEQIDFLLPVPLSIQKLHARGFNQSWELGKRIHCGQHTQKLPLALRRLHHPEPQAGSSVKTRHHAIKGIFLLEDHYKERLFNKTVVVFDDVMTSGATLNEIARLLKEHGVSRVINWVLLRTTRLT